MSRGDEAHPTNARCLSPWAFGGDDRFTRELGFAHLIDVHRGLRITEKQRTRFVQLYLDAMDAVGLTSLPRVRTAVVSRIEFGSHVAVHNSRATSDEDLHPLREVPRWALDPNGE